MFPSGWFISPASPCPATYHRLAVHGPLLKGSGRVWLLNVLYLLSTVTLDVDLSTPRQHGGLGGQGWVGADQNLQVGPGGDRASQHKHSLKRGNLFNENMLERLVQVKSCIYQMYSKTQEV